MRFCALLRVAAYAMAYAGGFRRVFMPKAARMARVFRNGRNQAVRIPREFEFAERDVEIRRQGDSLILSARPRDWAALAGTVATGEFLRWLESPGEDA
jgi:virulence-associated protein VagC